MNGCETGNRPALPQRGKEKVVRFGLRSCHVNIDDADDQAQDHLCLVI